MEPVFPSLYVQGYTAALMDALSCFESIEPDMKRHKRRWSRKEVTAIINCMIAGRVALRERRGFVRCNDKAPGGYEVYEER